jgi:hypothetical protein
MMLKSGFEETIQTLNSQLIEQRERFNQLVIYLLSTFPESKLSRRCFESIPSIRLAIDKIADCTKYTQSYIEEKARARELEESS